MKERNSNYSITVVCLGTAFEGKCGSKAPAASPKSPCAASLTSLPPQPDFQPMELQYRHVYGSLNTSTTAMTRTQLPTAPAQSPSSLPTTNELFTDELPSARAAPARLQAPPPASYRNQVFPSYHLVQGRFPQKFPGPTTNTSGSTGSFCTDLRS